MRAMLTLADREEISRGLAVGLEYKQIGVLVGRNPSVVSREVARHGGRSGYRAAAAEEAAAVSRARPKTRAVERAPGLREVVRERLRLGWSPASTHDWETYKVRLAAQGPRMSALGIDYYRSPQVPWPTP